MDILTYRDSEKPITPEHRLVLALITRAALDAMIPARKSKLTGKKKLGEYAQSALAFLFGSGLDAYCRWLALDVNYLRKQLLTRNQTTATKQCTITEHHWKCLRENFEIYLETRKRRKRLATVARTLHALVSAVHVH
jgi:hypothetical protein